MVREFVDRVFGGSAAPLLVHLIEDRQVTAQELDTLARRVRNTK
jgi:predicted transcriptional regulator